MPIHQAEHQKGTLGTRLFGNHIKDRMKELWNQIQLTRDRVMNYRHLDLQDNHDLGHHSGSLKAPKKNIMRYGILVEDGAFKGLLSTQKLSSLQKA